jgi:hypothetical protein
MSEAPDQPTLVGTVLQADEDRQSLVATRRSWLTWLLLVAIVLAVGDAFFLGPYLVREHARLTWFEILSLWSGEVVAIGWLLWICAKFFWSDEALLESTAATPEAIAVFRIAIGSILAALFIDAWQAVSFVTSQDAAFAQAFQTPGKVEKSTHELGARRWIYVVSCTFFDRDGERHEVVFRLPETDLNRFPPDAAQAIRVHNSTTVTISYDNTFPAKCWLTDLGAHPHNDLGLLVIAILGFQAVGAMVFVFAVHSDWSERQRLAWWHEAHGGFVLLSALFAFFVVGLGMLSVGESW